MAFWGHRRVAAMPLGIVGIRARRLDAALHGISCYVEGVNAAISILRPGPMVELTEIFFK